MLRIYNYIYIYIYIYIICIHNVIMTWLFFFAKISTIIINGLQVLIIINNN